DDCSRRPRALSNCKGSGRARQAPSEVSEGYVEPDIPSWLEDLSSTCPAPVHLPQPSLSRSPLSPPGPEGFRNWSSSRCQGSSGLSRVVVHPLRSGGHWLENRSCPYYGNGERIFRGSRKF